MDASRFVFALLLLVMIDLPLSHAAPVPQHDTTGNQTKGIARIRFYDKDHAEGHNFCTVAITQRPYIHTGDFFGCTNDEARSAKLEDLPPGSRIVLYDDKNCGDSDDYATITILEAMKEIIVRGFRNEVSYTDWKMTVHYDNGLMGKVSCAEVDIPGPPSAPAGHVAAPPAK